MNTKCGYCGNSVPFYNEIAAASPADGEKTRVLAVFSKSADEVKHYVREKHLNVQVIAGVNLPDLKVFGTPTMILVDADGKILDFWVGKLSTDGERRVAKLLNVSGA